MGEIERVVDDGVARITLNRPDAGNAITAGQRDQLIDWLHEAGADPQTRCVVIAATGRFFCTGADLRAADIPTAENTMAVGDIRRLISAGALRLVSSILDCEVPVIAAVQGTAAGLGAHIALACDVVVAADTAKFIELFVRRGLIADGLGAWLLPRLIGLRRAKELVLFGDDLLAPKAAEWGLINRAVPADALSAVVDEMAARLAAGPTLAHGANKWMMNRSLDSDRHTLAGEEAWLVEVMSRTEDAEEGIASFLEKRPPRFTGR
jgi:2-(1,2-epoxy-1,2-dihydrophenyl)acetyl-CoA isomerase